MWCAVIHPLRQASSAKLLGCTPRNQYTGGPRNLQIGEPIISRLSYGERNLCWHKVKQSDPYTPCIVCYLLRCNQMHIHIKRYIYAHDRTCICIILHIYTINMHVCDIIYIIHYSIFFYIVVYLGTSWVFACTRCNSSTHKKCHTLSHYTRPVTWPRSSRTKRRSSCMAPAPRKRKRTAAWAVQTHSWYSCSHQLIWAKHHIEARMMWIIHSWIVKFDPLFIYFI